MGLEIDKIPKIKRLKVPESKFDYLSKDEVRCLLEATKGLWREMILVAFKTGLRLGEIRGLRWEDINWSKRTLTVKRSIYRNIDK